MTPGVAVALASVALLTGACASSGSETTAEAVTDALTDAAGSGSGVVDLSEAVTGDWQRMVFACGYSDRATVEKALGFAWPDYTPTDQDGENIWVFATDNRVETWAMVPGYHGDPCFYEGERPSTVVGRDEARFRVEDTGERVLDGVPYRALRPVR